MVSRSRQSGNRPGRSAGLTPAGSHGGPTLTPVQQVPGPRLTVPLPLKRRWPGTGDSWVANVGSATLARQERPVDDPVQIMGKARCVSVDSCARRCGLAASVSGRPPTTCADGVHLLWTENA